MSPSNSQAEMHQYFYEMQAIGESQYNKLSATTWSHKPKPNADKLHIKNVAKSLNAHQTYDVYT